jgi:hypothetical protein
MPFVDSNLLTTNGGNLFGTNGATGATGFIKLERALQSLNLDLQPITRDTNIVLTGQGEVSNILTSEYDRLMANKQMVDDQMTSQQRISHLNDSARKRNDQYIKIIMIVIIVFVIFLLLIILNRNFRILPGFLMNILLIILFSIAGVLIVPIIYTLSIRDKINFDEIDIANPPSDSKTQAGLNENALNSLNLNSNLKTCTNNSCCDPPNTIWNPTTSKCEPGSTGTTQGFGDMITYSSSSFLSNEKYSDCAKYPAAYNTSIQK